MRRTVVAGQFYPERREELKKKIEILLSSLDVHTHSKENFIAGIAPHAGYTFSGKCAAHLFSIVKSLEIDTFIILGTNHSGLGENICFSIDDFDTPLGSIENDLELLEEILLKLNPLNISLGVNEQAHKCEHSIEVQLPFIKYTGKSKIVPILIKNLSIKEIEKAAMVLSKIVKESKKKIFVLASSDFTHYGKAYGFLPFNDKIRDNIYKLDEEAISSIVNLDTDSFYAKSRKTTICGGIPISLCLQIAKNLNLKSKKLSYYTSGDINNKWDNVVGYASIVFSKQDL